MRFTKEKELFSFMEDAGKAADPNRDALAQRMGFDGCYYEAYHWITGNGGPSPARGTITRLPVDYRPDSRDLRAISNDTSWLTQKRAAATNPRQMYMDVMPAEGDVSTDAHYRAGVHQRAINIEIDESRYIGPARTGNFRRCVFGTWGIGLCLERGADGSYLRSFDFDPSNLILDPNVQKLDLHDHQWVCYTDVWTVDRVNRTFAEQLGPKRALKPEDCLTFEQLEPSRVDLNRLSGGRLFSKWGTYASTRGVRVHQLHVRDNPHRFGYWYILLETGRAKERIWINEDDGDECPFGGAGLPFVLLHGYQRADTMWSWGEPAQVRDDQNAKNLVRTLEARILQNYGAPKWLIDKRAFGNRPSDDDISKQITNQVGGIISYTLSDRVQNVQPPQVSPMPAPPQFLQNMLAGYTDAMRTKTHTAPGNVGETPTHVPFRTTERVLEDAGQVASARVTGDVEAHTYLVGVMHATYLRLVQHRDPAALALFARSNFDAMDFGVMASADWTRPAVTMRVEEGSIRQASISLRKQYLDTAAQTGMIDKEDYQRAMATMVEMPLTEEYRQMTTEAQKAALAVLHGEDWVPRHLGRYSDLFIDQFVRAQMSPKAKADPATLARLDAAIRAQYALILQDQMAMNPELAMKAQAGVESATNESGAPEPDQSASVADVLESVGFGAGE